MSPPELNLVVVRSAQIDAARRFYEALGLVFVDEQHGNGPAHLSATLGSGLVFELYPASNAAAGTGTDVDVRLGFVVDGVMSAVDAATKAGGALVRAGAGRAVVADPDGRKVELVPRVAGVDLAAITTAYWRQHQESAPDAWAWDLVDGAGRGRATDAAIDPLLLFGELAAKAPDDAALAYLGAGPLEDYLRSDVLDLDLLADAVQANDNLLHAFRFAHLPPRLSPERCDRLRSILGHPPA